MDGMTAALILVSVFLLSLFMLSACKMAAISDEQNEVLFREWLIEHEKEA